MGAVGHAITVRRRLLHTGGMAKGILASKVLGLYRPQQESGRPPQEVAGIGANGDLMGVTEAGPPGRTRYGK